VTSLRLGAGSLFGVILPARLLTLGTQRVMVALWIGALRGSLEPSLSNDVCGVGKASGI
jgi:hypothetical protein